MCPESRFGRWATYGDFVKLDRGENPQGKELAQEIFDAQTAEIAEMKQVLGTL